MYRLILEDRQASFEIMQIQSDMGRKREVASAIVQTRKAMKWGNLSAYYTYVLLIDPTKHPPQ